MAGEASGPLAFTGKAAALLTEADSKFEEKFTALLLHTFVCPEISGAGEGNRTHVILPNKIEAILNPLY